MLKGTFETVTRAAITEILMTNAKESKFGHIFTEEGLQQAVDDLFNLLQTSRSLKAAGDRLLQMGPPHKVNQSRQTLRR